MGLSEEEARLMIVNGFIEEFTKELPMEYSVELNKLIQTGNGGFYRLMSDTQVQTNWTQHYQSEILPSHEAAWMKKLRKQAWEIYLDMPEPRPVQRSLRKLPELDRSQLQPMQQAALKNRRTQHPSAKLGAKVREFI